MRRARGFTLVEILIVVAVVGVLAALAVAAWNRSRSANDVDAWANTVRNSVTAVRRRATATATPYLVEVAPGSLGWCQVDAASCAADAALTCAAATGERSQPLGPGSQALTDSTAAVADVLAIDGSYTPPAKSALGGTRALYFGPNGSADLTCSHVLGGAPVSATGFTIYVRAANGEKQKRRRIVVYGATGRPRIIDNW